jgi:two-component system, cell cycle sensor histidine kinase and response regulator CckA
MMQTKQYVLYLVMVYGTSFLFVYLVDSVYERLPFAKTFYRNLLGGFLVGMVAPFIQWLIQGVNHPAMPPTMPDGRFLIIMIATVYYGVEGGAAAMMMVWAGSLFLGYPQVAFLFVHGLWLYVVGLALLKLSLKLPYSHHVFLVMGGTAINQIGSIPTVSFLVLSGATHAYFKSLPFVFLALETYTVAISLIFIRNRQRQERILNLKLSEQRLQESEEKFSTVFHTSPVSIGITRVSDNIIVDVNDAFLRIFGFEREEVVGRASYELNLWVQSEESFDRLNMLQGDGHNKYLETQFRTKSGGMKDVLIFADLMVVGREQYILYLIDDITERKHAETALAEAKKYLDKIINSIADPLFVKDRQHRWVLINEALHSLMGHTREEILGKSDYDYFPREEADIFWAKDEVVFTSGEEHVNEEMITDARGDVHIIATKKTLFTDERGEQFLVGVIRDITDRKRMEEALLESETQYRNLVESSLVGVYIIQDYLFKFVNKRYCEMTGYSYEEIVNRINPIDITHPEDRRAVEENIRKRISGEIDSVEYEIRTIRKDSRVIFTKVFGRCVIFQGKPTIMGTVIDITEQKRSEDDKTRLETQLTQAQKMESLGTLAGGIAHDFNNILTTIIGYGGLLQMNMDEASPLNSYVDSILSATQKAADLTKSLLTFSRQQPVTLAPLDINATIKGTEKLLKRLLTEDIDLRTYFTEDNTVVMADKTQMDQILFNLVTNARDAMPKGGTLTIESDTIEMDREFTRIHGFGEPRRYVLIKISDTGKGMDEVTREHIFDPFFTTKEVGKGTGLGLATVYGIVKKHGGYITVESTPNHGTIFQVYLPSVMATIDQEVQKMVSIRGGEETILIAEDNEGARHFMRDLLQQYGYKTVEAMDGEDAIGKFAQHQDIDLIILDSVMPKKNGREVYEAIRKVKPHIKALFTSGYTKDIILDKGIETKNFDYIAKPMSPTTLLQKVREVLDR